MDTFVAAVFLGIIGSGYFLYGKRAQRPVPLVCGALLCVFPYFIDSFIWTLVIGLALVAAPFVITL